jgi:hypothetical protein
MKKLFKIQNPNEDWECTVQVDDEFTFQDFRNPAITLRPIDAMTIMVEFWTGWKQRLALNDGDYQITFLQQLGREIFYILAAERLNVNGVIAAFSSREGWCDMDGKFGITILSVDELSWDHYEFEVVEVTES